MELTFNVRRAIVVCCAVQVATSTYRQTKIYEELYYVKQCIQWFSKDPTVKTSATGVQYLENPVIIVCCGTSELIFSPIGNNAQTGSLMFIL